MIISSIVAAGENSAIGLRNGLPWRLPNDTKFYKYTTWGLPVIMGRNSFVGLGYKPLPGRFNIVLTREKELPVKGPGHLWTAADPDSALALARDTDCEEVFIIGGARIYALFMDRTDRIFLTRVHARPEADTFFPEPDWSSWKRTRSRHFDSDEQHVYAYTFETWERKR